MIGEASGSQLVSRIPGANITGTNVSMPTSIVPGGSTPSIGGQTSPFLSAMPTGQTAFPANSPFASAGGFPTPNFPAIGGNVDWNMLYHGLGKIYGSGQAQALVAFLQSGAGFNPQVVSAFINALQPEFAREQANLTEQFGASGLRGSSAAAIGLGDLLSQQGLNVEQVLASMYEQAVQEYQNTLSGAVRPMPHHSIFGSILGAVASVGLAPFTGGASLIGLGSSLGGIFGGGGGGGYTPTPSSSTDYYGSGPFPQTTGSAAPNTSSIAPIDIGSFGSQYPWLAPLGSGSSDVNTLGY